MADISTPASNSLLKYSTSVSVTFTDLFIDLVPSFAAIFPTLNEVMSNPACFN